MLAGPVGASRGRARGRWQALGRGAPCRPGSRAHAVRSAGTQAGEPVARGQAGGRARQGRWPRVGRAGGRGARAGGRAGGRGGCGRGARAEGRAGARRRGRAAAGARAARVINYARARAARGTGAGSAPRWRPPQSRPPQPRRLCSPAAPPGPRARAAAASPAAAAAAVSRPGAPGPAPLLGLGSPLAPGPWSGLAPLSPGLCRRARRAVRGPRSSRGFAWPWSGVLPFVFWTGVLEVYGVCRGSRGAWGTTSSHPWTP